MPVSAHILVVANKEDDALLKKLNDAGYAASYVSYSTFDSGKSVQTSHDLVLLVTAGTGIGVSDLTVQFFSLPCPVLIIGENPAPEKIQSIPDNYCDMELNKRVSSLIRFQVMKREFERRSQTTLKYGFEKNVVAPPELNLENKEVLLVGAKSETLGEILLQLDSKSKIHICQNADQAMAELQEKRFDATIIVGTGQGDVNLRLCNDIRADSKLFNLPVIFVLDFESNRQAAYVHGASDIVVTPQEMPNLRARVSLLVQQAEYRYSLQKLFKESKPLPVSDGPTGLYSFGFMSAHLASLQKDYEAEEKALSLASLKVSNLEEINDKYGFPAGDQILRQIGSIISFLVRGEDICCRYKNGTFLIALPSTTLNDARIALNRVYGVSRMTDLAVNGLDEPVNAVMDMGLVELVPGESIEAAIKRGKGVHMVMAEAS